ncbi:MAG: formate dehydrogenase accessory sulfurtransferase FdhD [Synergistaceae bacterium]|jgi:FdhD protein|nr:formate dehydrogenase accessory sulfurtransferase FdhD [Synergistaceae bacterium]
MSCCSQDIGTETGGGESCAAGAKTFTITKINGSETMPADDMVAVEQPLTVYLNGREFMTIVHSPGQERELIVGLLASEGIIRGLPDVRGISIDSSQGTAFVETSPDVSPGEANFMKRYFSSCCGRSRASFYFVNDARTAGVRTSFGDLRVSSGDVSRYMEMLDAESVLFRRTGGVHGGALTSDGRLGSIAFDIGRHNVLDKLYGSALSNGGDLSRQIIVFSGRIASEIVIKTGKMGCPIIAGAGAPTNLAIELARKLGVTVIGFVRRNRMNVYSYPERIASG